MKTIPVMLLILCAATCADVNADDQTSILNPRLPNAGGHAAKCLKDLIQPFLEAGQSFISFAGPHSDTDRAVTDYEMTTRLPVAHFKLRFTTQDRDGWQPYQYMQGDMPQIGMYSVVMTRTAAVLLRKDADGGPYDSVASIDLTPCEALLQAGN